MALSDLLRNDITEAAFQLLATAGLFLNGLIVTGNVQFTGDEFHAASIILFGMGAMGLATIYGVEKSEDQDFFDPISAIYGGLILGTVTSTLLAWLVVTGRFNNLLAMFVLGGFAVTYIDLWNDFKNSEKGDYFFHSS